MKTKTMEKISETRSCFFKKINQIGKTLARWTKEEKSQITKIRN